MKTSMDKNIDKMVSKAIKTGEMLDTDHLDIAEIYGRIDAMSKEIKTEGKVPVKKVFEGANYSSVRQLTRCIGMDFLIQCYRVLLNRNLDESGKARYVELLKNGFITKKEVIEEIRFSPEGKTYGVELKGLNSLHFWCRVKRKLCKISVFRKIYNKLYFLFHRKSILIERLLIENDERIFLIEYLMNQINK